MDSTLAQRKDYYSRVLHIAKQKQYEAPNPEIRAFWDEFLMYFVNQGIASTVRGAKTWFANHKGTYQTVQSFRVTYQGELTIDEPKVVQLKGVKHGLIGWAPLENGQVSYETLLDYVFLSSSDDSLTLIEHNVTALTVILFHSTGYSGRGL